MFKVGIKKYGYWGNELITQEVIKFKKDGTKEMSKVKTLVCDFCNKAMTEKDVEEGKKVKTSIGIMDLCPACAIRYTKYVLDFFKK